MALTVDQENVVRNVIIDMFGEDTVKDIDMKWFAFHEIRISSMHNLDFLAKIREQYQDNGIDVNTLIAAVLYGIRLGEIGREFAYEQERRAGDVQYQ